MLLIERSGQNPNRKMVESELSIWPSIKSSVQLTGKRTSILRDESAEFFDDTQTLEFSVIDKLLIESFSARNSESRKRPYPSGGGLYPIDVFVCRVSEKISDWPTGDSIFTPPSAIQTIRVNDRPLP